MVRVGRAGAVVRVRGAGIVVKVRETRHRSRSGDRGGRRRRQWISDIGGDMKGRDIYSGGERIVRNRGIARYINDKRRLDKYI